MENNIDKNKLFESLSNGGNISKSAINNAKNGNLDLLINALPENERQKLKNALNNKQLAQKILNSKEAQQIMRSLKKDK